MTPLDPRHEDGPELVPPVELLRLRNMLVRAPGTATRAQHLAATTVAARQRTTPGPMGRFASRGTRFAVGIVASLAITSGLAGAQMLPESAQRLLSNVSDRFAPSPATPTTIEEPDAGPSPAGRRSAAPADDGAAPAGATASTDTVATTASPTTITSATSLPPAPATTLPGPTGPGSPEDPTGPEPTTTTTTDPGSTTTTTSPGTTTTTSTTSTTSTTQAPPP